MEVIELAWDDFFRLGIISHCFNSPEFIKQTSSKTENIKILAFKTTKVKMVIVFGINNEIWRSPFSAPFGGFIPVSSNISVEDIDNIITNNAIDCALMKNINYFPKSIFQLGVIEIETSQGKRVKYELGDDPKYEPICSQDINIDKSGYKSERYKHLLKMGQKELKNQLEKYIENNIFYIEIQRLIKDINIDEDILMYTIYKSIKPNILLENYYISPYIKGIKLNKIDKINYSRKIKIVIKDDEINNFKSKSNEPQDNIENIIKLLNIDFNDIIKTIISIYLCDSKYVLIIINHILHNYKDINDNTIKIFNN